MGKRMTATEKWDKEWFMELSPKLKCLWQYINDKCDQAGMWEENYKLATMHIGEPVIHDDMKAFGDRIEKFAPGKIWICGHVDFQCGNLSEKSPAHKPIFKLLKKYNLLNRVLNRLPSSQQEKEIEKEIELEEEKEKEYTPDFTKFELLWNAAFDQRTIENYKMQYRFVAMDEELSHFRLICDSDPPNYHQRDSAGLRQAFLYQLKNGKQKNSKPPTKKLTDLTNL